MILRYLSTGVYWVTFLYFVNYTIDIILKVEKECNKKQMDNLMKMKCFLTNVKLLVGVLCCFITYYLAYYSPQFTKGSLVDTVIGGIEKRIEQAVGIPTK